MTIEYLLLVVATFFFVIKAMLTVPQAAFKESGPRLAARIEQQLETGSGFKPERGSKLQWKAQD